MPIRLPFSPAINKRADLKPGAMYAIDGGDNFIYYAQVAPNKQLGFFRFRSLEVEVEKAMNSEFMSRFSVTYPSIGRAIRSGNWLSLGRRPLKSELVEDPVLVQWPVGTLEVTLWKSGKILRTTLVHDPEIQNLEIIQAYDAIGHVPRRLQADYTLSDMSWAAGGSVKRARLRKQDMASRFPNQPWHELLEGWVFVSDDS